jgi:hypothetical protein
MTATMKAGYEDTKTSETFLGKDGTDIRSELLAQLRSNASRLNWGYGDRAASQAKVLKGVRFPHHCHSSVTSVSGL